MNLRDALNTQAIESSLSRRLDAAWTKDQPGVPRLHLLQRRLGEIDEPDGFEAGTEVWLARVGAEAFLVLPLPVEASTLEHDAPDLRLVLSPAAAPREAAESHLASASWYRIDGAAPNMELLALGTWAVVDRHGEEATLAHDVDRRATEAEKRCLAAMDTAQPAEAGWMELLPAEAPREPVLSCARALIRGSLESAGPTAPDPGLVDRVLSLTWAHGLLPITERALWYLRKQFPRPLGEGWRVSLRDVPAERRRLVAGELAELRFNTPGFTEEDLPTSLPEIALVPESARLGTEPFFLWAEEATWPIACWVVFLRVDGDSQTILGFAEPGRLARREAGVMSKSDLETVTHIVAVWARR